FPCQDISNAGQRKGIKEGKRSSLWFKYRDIVRDADAWGVFAENVGALSRRGLDIVLRDLAELGFDAEWLTLRASDVGASHGRKRLFILAVRRDRLGYAGRDGREGRDIDDEGRPLAGGRCEGLADAGDGQLPEQRGRQAGRGRAGSAGA